MWRPPNFAPQPLLMPFVPLAPSVYLQSWLKSMLRADTWASQFTSHYALAVDVAIGGTIRIRFYDEARKLLDNEAGKPSIPSAQALYILYMYSTSAAMDRAEYVYRMAACEMFKRLRLGMSLSKVQRDDKQARRTLSRNAWGFFCLER